MARLVESAMYLPQSPFRPIDNPLRRVLPAVVEIRDRVTASVRGIAERIHRSHTQDAVRLERARAIIENAIPHSSSRLPVTGMEGSLDRVYGERSRTTQDDTRDRMEANSNHQRKAAKALAFAADAGKYVMSHKLDTAKAVGRVGVKIAPTVATAVAVNIAAGALAAPVIAARAVGSGLNDIRRTVGSIKGKNIFATSETLRHGFAAVARSTSTESPQASGVPTLLQRIAQSPIGKVWSGYAHIEQNVAAQVVAHNAHISTIREFGLGKSRAEIESFVSTMSPEEMFTLRKHAVMARLTTDPKDTLRTVIHNIHRATSLHSAQLKKTATQSPDSAALPQYIALERQFKRGAFAAYRRRVYEATGAHLGANLVKTIGTSLAFFYGGHLFGFHSANPFEHSTFWSNIADKAKELVHRGGARVEDGITQLLNASTPHAEAAELTLSEHLASHDTPVLPVTHLGQAITGTHTVAPEAVLTPAAPQKIVEIQKAQQEALQELRDLRDHAPMVPRVSGSVFTSQPVVVTPSTSSEARAVLTSVSEMHTAGGTIQVDGTSLSQTLWNMRGTTTVAQSLPWLAQAKTLTEAYTSPDSAHAMWEHVILPSRDKITTEGFSRLQALIESPENAHASFAQIWKQYHALYDDHFGGLDTWGYEGHAQTVTLAVDHADTVGFADGSASATHAARMSIPEHETLPGGPKVHPRLVRMELDTTSKDHTAVGSPPPMTPTEYEAMKARILNGGTAPLPASSSSTPPIPGQRMSAAEYEAMKTRTVGTATAPPTSAATGAGPMLKTGMSPAEYEAMKARSSGGIPSSAVAPPGHTPNSAPRMTVEEYEKMKQVSQAAEQVKPKASSTMTPDQYEQMKREILAKNGGVPSASSGTTLSEPLPLPHTEAPIGPIDLREAPSHAVSISSNRPDLFTNVSNGQWTQVVNPEVAIDTPGYSFGAATYFYDEVHGGMVISMHDGRYNKVLQAWEGMREYPQGYGFRGAGRLGPIQQEMRISKIFDPSELAKLGITQNTFDFNFDGKTTVHTILESVQYSPQDGELILGQPANLIGGGPDTITAIICSWGHVEAIQMILDHAKDVPPSLQSTFAILNDPQASGGQIEKAVQKLVNEWLKTDSDFDFAKFHNIFGNFLGDKPKTFDELLNRGKDGLVGRGRLVLRFRVSGHTDLGGL